MDNHGERKTVEQFVAARLSDAVKSASLVCNCDDALDTPAKVRKCPVHGEGQNSRS